MGHSPYCEADSRSLGKDVNCVLCRPNVHHTGPYPEANLFALKLISCFSKDKCNIKLSSKLWLMSRQECEIYFPKNVQTHTGAYPATYLVGTGSIFPGGKLWFL
jgi:hypothetical protein